MKKMPVLPSILSLIVFLSTCSLLKGQVSKKVFDKPINIPGSLIRIDSLLLQFTKQTGVEFSFNSNRVKPSGMVAIPSKKLSLLQWLQQLELTPGLQHRVVGNHIILIDKNKSSQPAVRTNKSAATGSNVEAKSVIYTATEKPGAGSAANNIQVSPQSNNEPALITALRYENPDDINTEQRHRSLFPNSIDTQTESVKKRAVKMFQPVSDPSNSTSLNQTGKQGGREYAGVIPLTKVDLGLQGAGFSFERRLSHHSIIDFSIGAGGGYAITGKEFTYKLNIDAPDFYVSVNPRFYYNRSKRAEKGKSMRMNAGNYFGIRLKYVTDALSENFVVWDVLLFNIHWGFQRPIGGHWLLNGHIGPGYGFTVLLLQYNHWYPSGELKLSYVFGKRALEE